MRVVTTSDKDSEYKLPTTKTAIVIDKYQDETKKVVSTRLDRIKNKVKYIIEDEGKLSEFLMELKKDLSRKPSISMKSIIKRATKY